MKCLSGRLARLFCLLLLLSLVACQEGTEEGPAYGFLPSPVPTEGLQIDPALANTRWRLLLLNRESFPGHIMTTMIFDAGEIRGYTGCNKWEGDERVVAAGGVLSIPVVSKETGGCAYPELEKDFVYALTLHTSAYRREGTRLFLVDEVGEEVLVFTNERSTDRLGLADS